jgi:hypothetical protein
MVIFDHTLIEEKMMFRKMMTIALLVTTLCGCATMKYGVPEAQYNQMSPAQQAKVRADYPALQKKEDEEANKIMFAVHIASILFDKPAN